MRRTPAPAPQSAPQRNTGEWNRRAVTIPLRIPPRTDTLPVAYRHEVPMATRSKRIRSTNSRELGTNPRATGTNPRARAAARGDAPAPRARKNMRLDQALLDQARAV